MSLQAVFIPIRVGRGLNMREHWADRSKRIKAEREATAWLLKGQPSPNLPCVVTLTRSSPFGRRLDDDNNVGALKAFRDEIAAWLTVDDAKSDIVRYEYAQARGEWGVKVEFEGMK